MTAPRETIINTIKTRLQTILTTTTNQRYGVAYRTDVGRKVEFGMSKSPEASNCPMINFYNLDEEVAPNNNDNTNKGNARLLPFTIEAYKRSGTLSLPEMANQMVDDLESALLYTSGVRDNTLGGTVLNIAYIRHTPFLLQTDTSVGGVLLEVSVEYDPEDS